MNAPEPKAAERMAALQGLGDSRLRKEDARFIQGKGHYVDDIKLPGMLHMDIVRSPFAHARIKGIDKIEAMDIALSNKFDYRIKLVAEAFRANGSVRCRVAPVARGPVPPGGAVAV